MMDFFTVKVIYTKAHVKECSTEMQQGSNVGIECRFKHCFGPLIGIAWEKKEVHAAYEQILSVKTLQY